MTVSAEEATAEITRFYANYHSIRYVGDNLVLRLQHSPTDAQLADLNARFAHLVARGRIERADPFDIERRHADHVELPRLRFAFRRHRSGDLRALIDAVNGFVSPGRRTRSRVITRSRSSGGPPRPVARTQDQRPSASRPNWR